MKPPSRIILEGQRKSEGIFGNYMCGCSTPADDREAYLDFDEFFEIMSNRILQERVDAHPETHIEFEASKKKHESW